MQFTCRTGEFFLNDENSFLIRKGMGNVPLICESVQPANHQEMNIETTTRPKRLLRCLNIQEAEANGSKVGRSIQGHLKNCWKFCPNSKSKF